MLKNFQKISIFYFDISIWDDIFKISIYRYCIDTSTSLVAVGRPDIFQKKIVYPFHYSLETVSIHFFRYRPPCTGHECSGVSLICYGEKTTDCMANGSHFFIYMKKTTFYARYWKWLSSSAIQAWAHLNKFEKSFFRVCLLTFLISSLFRAFKLRIFCEAVLYTLFLRYAHQKKIQRW